MMNDLSPYRKSKLDGERVYLACPYSHPDEGIMQNRYRVANRVAWWLMQDGARVFSPISHSHAMEQEMGEQEDHEFWMFQDLSYLEYWASAIVVIQTAEWKQSDGVMEELETADDLGIPRYSFNPLRVLALVGISGKKRSGKDTMGDVFSEYAFEKYALADPIKESCKDIFNLTEDQIGGELKEEEDPFWGMTPREIMQHFGTDAFREYFGDDVWVKSLLQTLRLELPMRAVVTDVRFPNEVRPIQRAGGDVIRIDASERLEDRDEHASENALDDYGGFDSVVTNNGSLEEFKDKCHKIAQSYA